MSDLETAIFGRRPAVPDAPGEATFAEGKITKVEDDGSVMFKVLSWDNGTFAFGPAPCPYVAAVGYRCLVLMPETSADSVTEPWVIGVWPP